MYFDNCLYPCYYPKQLIFVHSRHRLFPSTQRVPFCPFPINSYLTPPPTKKTFLLSDLYHNRLVYLLSDFIKWSHTILFGVRTLLLMCLLDSFILLCISVTHYFSLLSGTPLFKYGTKF